MQQFVIVVLFSFIGVIACLPAKDVSTGSQCQIIHSGSCVLPSDQSESCTVKTEDHLCTTPGYVCCVPKQEDNTQPVVNTPGNAWFADCGVNKYNNSLGHVKRKVRRSKRVIGGVEASVGEIPWQVSVQIGGTSRCGGVLINNRYVLTAAHCVECSPESAPDCGLVEVHEVMLGAHSLTQPTSNTRTIFIESATVHPGYVSDTLENDIALLRMSRDIEQDIRSNEDINPVCAPDQTFDYSGMVCYMSGWGKTGYPLGPKSDTLRYVDLPVVSKESCCAKHCDNCNADNCVIYDHNICAGYEENSNDACSGDSGGGLVCSVDNRYSLVGISSWGDGCGTRSNPGVYASVASFLEWINLEIN